MSLNQPYKPKRKRFSLYTWNILFLSLYVSTLIPVQAQYNHLTNLTGKNREQEIRKICDSIYYAPDTVTAFAIADRFRTYAQKNNNDSLVLHIDLCRAFVNSRRFAAPEDQDRLYTVFKDLLQKAIKKKFITNEINIRDVIANFYWDRLDNYELALQEYNTLNRLIERVSLSSFPDKIKIYFHIGYAYFYFKDYVKALELFKQAVAISPDYDFQQYPYVHSLNNIAIAYRELNKLDSSDYYLQQLQQYATVHNDSIWLGINSGNIGENEYLKGNYDKAIPLLQFCIAMGIKIQDAGLAAGSQMVLANIYFKQNNNKAAIQATLKARELVLTSQQYPRYRYLYPLMAKMYAVQGQPLLAGSFIDSGFVAVDSINRTFSGILMARALQKDALALQKAGLAEAANSKKLMNIKMYAALSIAAIILFTTLFIYRIKRKQHQEENELKDGVIKKSMNDLENAQIQLEDFTQNIAEKNKLIEEMEKQFGNDNKIAELEKSIILTGSDWRRFKDSFEQVHPGFLQRLQEKIPGISPAEIRLLTLAKLNFSNKEMASALGITPQAIRVNWHRLRKKINLGDEALSMEELVNMV